MNPSYYGEIILVNDSRTLYGKDREDRLKELFAERGIEVVFED